MNLYLLRHGIAAEPGATGFKDDERPLVPKGVQKLGKVARALGKLEISFDLILSSPYLRARQTAEIIAEKLDLKKRLEFADALMPGNAPGKLIALLEHFEPPPPEVLLVGHEPFLSDLISLLISGQTTSSVAMKKGGLCKLGVERLRPGRCATLEWLLTPKQMGLMV